MKRAVSRIPLDAHEVLQTYMRAPADRPTHMSFGACACASPYCMVSRGQCVKFVLQGVFNRKSIPPAARFASHTKHNTADPEADTLRRGTRKPQKRVHG